MTNEERPRRGLGDGSSRDLHWATAQEISQGVRQRDFSAEEVLSAVTRRIETVNAGVNCITELYLDDARQSAAALDKAIGRGETAGPLAGVPFVMKEMTPVPGKRTTFGCRAFAEHVIDFEPEILRRLRAAGAILIGKATCSEFVSEAYTETELFGVTRNPWNRERTTGGSSGGSGAAVAAGMVPIAEGSDMGGSIRSPATYCGVVGLKPSVGRIPFDIMPTCFESMIHFGPIAATVDDAALFLDATAGPSDKDILSLPPSGVEYAKTGSDIRGLKLALNYDFGYYHVEPGVIENLDRTVEALRELGAEVEPVEINWSREIEDRWYENWYVYLATFLGNEIEERADLVSPVVLDSIKKGRAIDAVSYKSIELLRTRIWSDLAKIFENHDALICPATSRTAPAAGGKDEDLLGYGSDGKLRGGALHLHFNFVSQCPSISVPMGLSSEDGMPTSVQFVGRRFDESTIFRLGRAVEQLPFGGTRLPPI